MSPAQRSTVLSLADRLALILVGLRGAVAARMATDRSLVPILTLLWSRLHRMSARFARLTGAPASAPKTLPPRNVLRRSGPADRLPRGIAWLLKLVPEAAAYGSQLQALLADPAMATLLATTPQAGGILRPLCRILAVVPCPAMPPREPLARPATATYPREVATHPPAPPTSRSFGVFALA